MDKLYRAIIGTDELSDEEVSDESDVKEWGAWTPIIFFLQSDKNIVYIFYTPAVKSEIFLYFYYLMISIENDCTPIDK